jgi:hypothetical protein
MWKGDELHVNILAARIPDIAITTWRKSAMPSKRRGNPMMTTVLVSSSTSPMITIKEVIWTSEADE